MITVLANPQRFLAFSRVAAPILGALAAILAAAALWTGWSAPDDYQQGATVRLMFIHVPAAITGMLIYGCLAGSAFFGLVFRHLLADAAARAAAPLGAAVTLLGLITGSFWGRPMWGAWWVWDARLTSYLILFLFFVGYMALQASIDDETKADRASGILAMVGVIMLPIVHYSVLWWNSLHQGETIFAPGGPKASAVYLTPLFLMWAAYSLGFGALWMVRIRGEIWRRRAQALAVQGAR
ncbi:MAG TPA: heme ABC transporter permease CcmC [Caulobacteraceae bacterium]|jgi:heme exporter protein C